MATPRSSRFELDAIARVRGGRVEPIDDNWGSVACDLVLDERFGPEAFQGLDAFSHALVVFVFDGVEPGRIDWGTRRPRGNPAWPDIGIFAQRGSTRPNRLGVTTAEIVKLDGRALTVRGLDAIDGTPVLDIKPVISGFEPRGAIRQPDWAREIMQDYW